MKKDKYELIDLLLKDADKAASAIDSALKANPQNMIDSLKLNSLLRIKNLGQK